MNNEANNNELNVKSNNSSKIIIAILAILLVGALGFICYDKFINNEKPPVSIPTDEGAKTIKLDKIELTNDNQTTTLGNNTYTVLSQLEAGYLYINNEAILDSDGNNISAHSAYITDDFMFFVGNGQSYSESGEMYQEYITYAIDVNGDRISINNDSHLIVDSFYPLRNIRVENGEIIADGLRFSDADNYTLTKLVIKNENNMVTIVPKN